tara:strand:- start:171882 stop:173057 length:1176 start_codon:yes stop_codon:yes gene_type:complete
MKLSDAESKSTIRATSGRPTGPSQPRGAETSSGSIGSSAPLDSSAANGPTKENSSVGVRRSGSGWLMIAVTFVALLLVMIVGAFWAGFFDRSGAPVQSPTLSAIPAVYDADRAMGYLKKICDIGPRPSGTEAMQRQQKMLQEFFTQQGAGVSMQTFEIRHPQDGSAVPMANLIARWNVDRPKRYLLCAHYDTRPFPDQDRRNRKGIFIGANDGGSGTAALMEMSHQMADLPSDVGVDMVLFDGEEFIWEQGRDEYFLGSKYFARNYVAEPPAIPYRAGVLLDMVADRELKIYYEQNSLSYAPEIARGIWKTADRLGVRAFVPRSRHRVEDDHIPLNQIAKIPTVDLIDFDYPRAGIGAPSYWHTEQDIPANCSGESIAAVVWVVHEWLKQQ